MEYHIQVAEEQWIGRKDKTVVVETMVIYADNLDESIAEIVVTNNNAIYDLMQVVYDCVEEESSYYLDVWRTVTKGATAYVYSREQWFNKRHTGLVLTIPLEYMVKNYILTPEVMAQYRMASYASLIEQI